jgi:CBS domain-containing protein
MKRAEKDNALTVREIMTRAVTTIEPENTLRDLVELLTSHGISGVPVVCSDRIVGVISMSDLLDFIAITPPAPSVTADQAEWGELEFDPEGKAADQDEESVAFYTDLWADAGADLSERFAASNHPEWDVLSEHTVASIMTQKLVTLSPDTSVAEAAREMLSRGIHRVLVVEHGELEGIVSSTDLMKALA